MQHYLSFHPYIASAYTAVHDWLETKSEADGYKKIHFKDITRSLSQNTLKSAAAQYYALFPAHYFKLTHTLREIIGLEQLLEWIKYNPHICLIDVGCGAGAASVSFIETILYLQEIGNFNHSPNIFCLGVDINPGAVALYSQLMEQVKAKVVSSKINLEYEIVPYGIPDAMSRVIRRCKQKCDYWQQPCLAHVLIMQVNVVSLLSSNHEDCKQLYSNLKALGVSSDVLVDDYEEFGHVEALAYKQLFEEVPIDHMHVITIGTDYSLLQNRVREMGNALKNVFSRSLHTVKQIGEGTYRVDYANPDSSYWIEKHQQQYYYSEFHVDISTINSAGLKSDQDWIDVTSLENLKLAWVRARHNFFTESLFDEIEIRLFEKNLDANLNRLQQQLIAYTEDVAHTHEQISYKFIKQHSSGRLKILSRMEEEILSVAIIQKLGDKADSLQSSNAYRLARRNGNQETEYLYEPWFNAYYDSFLAEARRSAEKHENALVLKVDIKSYYTKIIQDHLIELAMDELRTESERIRWLLRILLSQKLDEHEIGRGITQGGSASGFYANIYLTSIDAKFRANNAWDVEYHRYLDDIILIIPNPQYFQNVLDTLQEELFKLGLSLNEEKTQIYEVTEFIQQTQDDNVLNKINTKFNNLMTHVWVMNEQYRTEFRNYYDSDEKWWYFLEQYRICLESIGIYITAPELSRKIYKYIFKHKREVNLESCLVLTSLPDNSTPENIHYWRLMFNSLNLDWTETKYNLHLQLVDLFYEVQEQLKYLSDINPEREIAERRIRFVINKLIYLGFASISRELIKILCDYPWLIRKPLPIVESLARQGHRSEVMKLLEYYTNCTAPTAEYMRSITLRAIRFLPSIDAHDWNTLVYFATKSNSTVEKIMATETWLYLINYFPNLITQLVQEQHISSVVKALNSNPAPVNRLKKNYLLILGQYKREDIIYEVLENETDYILDEASNMALEGGLENLFQQEEPSIIRHKYYSGKRQSSWNSENNGY
ncbi:MULTISPECIES: RNA-directed DNA polymerase [Calothrix]|uniref:RNA-directed DNA polymerase n=2 Tax=Calothrix TaxID=1186 RepID=A0ABR8A8G5_9CYAN|nr:MULTISPECIES: RNA-directed DNA polymerase [Calothrix]MBD2196295.1 RNA-directed DNA polymerase [Calothrix parietina FACHB-288]MBD2224947.1 RNA-directed DNA polymerase [Calothrix anomala FACHB-343]